MIESNHDGDIVKVFFTGKKHILSKKTYRFFDNSADKCGMKLQVFFVSHHLCF